MTSVNKDETNQLVNFSEKIFLGRGLDHIHPK